MTDYKLENGLEKVEENGCELGMSKLKMGRREKGGQVLEIPRMKKLLGVLIALWLRTQEFLLCHSPFSLYILTLKKIKS